ncbi:MAG: hypothetical protein V3V00_12540 [Saprospiraceae bacterium]
MSTAIKFILSLSFLVLFSLILMGQVSPQTQSDSYTRYELLSPTSQAFRIIYDVSATSAGKAYYFNTLRKGSEHKIDNVYDQMTGTKLEWEIVSGIKAKLNGHPQANDAFEYLMVQLARPVPANGEARIRIDKTYKDALSYYSKDGNIIFERSLGIKRNAVVLPTGYELISCNYPSQVELENDGRIKLSFINRGLSAVNYKIIAKKLPTFATNYENTNDPSPWVGYVTKAGGRDKSKARINYQLSERAYQNREIVYFPLQPETHSFRLYHDYTETREGRDKYINVVRPGSKASNPSAFILDTGEKLKVETLQGQEIIDSGIDIGSVPDQNTEIVVIRYPVIQKGQSLRMRIEETYTDPNRYLIFNNELVWDRSFGRNRNTLILPKGWWLTTNSIPAIIDKNEEGLTRLYYLNDRDDSIDVLIKGRRKF